MSDLQARDVLLAYGNGWHGANCAGNFSIGAACSCGLAEWVEKVERDAALAHPASEPTRRGHSPTRGSSASWPEPATAEDAPASTEIGWLVLQGPLRNQHVIPAEQQGTEAHHDPEVGCWCEPRRAYPEEPDPMGADVYLHRRSHDHGHRYADEER